MSNNMYQNQQNDGYVYSIILRNVFIDPSNNPIKDSSFTSPFSKVSNANEYNCHDHSNSNNFFLRISNFITKEKSFKSINFFKTISHNHKFVISSDQPIQPTISFSHDELLFARFYNDSLIFVEKSKRSYSTNENHYKNNKNVTHDFFPKIFDETDHFYVIKFKSEIETQRFLIEIGNDGDDDTKFEIVSIGSSFHPHTDQSMALNHTDTHIKNGDAFILKSYFEYYGKLANQMNMLQDSIRTNSYKDAILKNQSDFCDRIVMDIGAGSGILSFFAVQAQAKLVYAVEASRMASAIQSLLDKNESYKSSIVIINKLLEDTDLSDLVPFNKKVDILISEPIGIFIFNERMIETYIYARDKFLKHNGKMFPNKCKLYLAPFSDQNLYNDFSNRSNFWLQTNFHGVDLNSLHQKAMIEDFSHPVIDLIDPSIILCQPHVEEFDFETINRADLSKMEFHFKFCLCNPTLVHGLAGWFDVIFDAGESNKLSFSTSPYSNSTHWHQIRFVLLKPLAVNPMQVVSGTMVMEANNQQSYYIKIRLGIEGTDITSETTVIDLKEQDYRGYANSYLSNYLYNYSRSVSPQIPIQYNNFSTAASKY